MSESSNSPIAAAVLVAAGLSTRMRGAGGSGPRKPWVELLGSPIVDRTVGVFHRTECIREIVIVAHADDVEAFERRCAENDLYAKVRAVVAGGETRADSVRNGVKWCSFDMDVIAVHDAARPLVRSDVVHTCVARASETGAALVAAPVHDTIKRSADGETVNETLDRDVLWRAQTPQCFRARELRDVLDRAAADGFRPTDDAGLWERYVGPVAIVPSDSSNMKVTTPTDLALAEAWLRARATGDSPA